MLYDGSATAAGTATAGEAAGFGAEVPTVDRFTPRRAADGFAADDTGPAAATGRLVAAVAAAGSGVLGMGVLGMGVLPGPGVMSAVGAGVATRRPRSPADATAVREARATGLRRAVAPEVVDPDSELLLVALSEAPAPSAPESAMATAAPPTIAAPIPRATALAPSQAYGWMRRRFDTDRFPRVVIQLP